MTIAAEVDVTAAFAAPAAAPLTVTVTVTGAAAPPDFRSPAAPGNFEATV